ncbi:hypothetical protein MBLNU230_g2283t1 [Neophaeotheca triangularis]
MAPSPHTRTIPLIPLPYGVVLLPGVTTRIPVAGRPDVSALIYHHYQQNANAALSVGCIPLNSPYLSPDGNQLLESGDSDPSNGNDKAATTQPTNPSEARRPDLFSYGTIARVMEVQGSAGKEGGALVVKGLSRFRVEKILRDRMYFEARVTVHEDAPLRENDEEAMNVFATLRQRSAELVTMVRLAAQLSRQPSENLSGIFARRLQLYIARKDLQEAGMLADFMISIIDCAHEDRLRILAALDVKERLGKVVEVLQKSIGNINGNGRILTITNVPQNERRGGNLDIETLNKLRQDPRIRRMMGQGQRGGGQPPNGPPGGNAGQGEDEEENEVAQLKKRLDEAKLPPEAQKVVDKELKRLGDIPPMQAEHQVVRNYLENLAEIPWSKFTEDNLNRETLANARKQLDDDHYGLEKIKKRLLEYLAVLKLKQGVNADLDGQIKKIEDAEKAQKEPEQQVAEQEPREKKEEYDPQRSAEQINKQKEAEENISPRKPSSQEKQLLQRKKMVDKSPILLLVGPPGTGKTSLAKSVATALGRKFHRISLGGVRDEAEIRGHRRTYVAAMPGLIVSGLKKVEVSNPVFLLDEIDKLGMAGHHGDPSAAMLEVLDPEQNHTFVDHYVNIPLDLSKVIFIATANSLDTIPAPLLDRMETIQLSGYTTLEKRAIASRHLLPKQITTNGLAPENLSLPEDVLDKVITSYTREAGVRNLERELGALCRHKAVEYSESSDASNTTTPTPYNPSLTIPDLEEILGPERFEEELAATSAQPGVVTGLVAYSSGAQGSILFIEIADMPGTGRVQLTGKLGDVLKESVEVALSWVKAHAFELGVSSDPTEDVMKNRAIHVHCPSGAVPKDGPSAGLAHTIALISLFSGRAVPPSLAMTGEVSLRGKVMPVGGIREKLIGALRAGVKKVLLPNQNRRDLKEVSAEVKEGLEIACVGSVWEALGHVWPGVEWESARSGRGWGVDARL